MAEAPGLISMADLHQALKVPTSGQHGYTAAHALYEKVRRMLQAQAVHVGGPPLELVIVKAFLAVQQMRRQEKDGSGYRGKSKFWCWTMRPFGGNRADRDGIVAATASVCGFYCSPSKL